MAPIQTAFDELIEQQLRNFDTLKRHCKSAREAVGTGDLTLAALNNRLRLISQIWELCVTTDVQIHKTKQDETSFYFTDGRFEAWEKYFLQFNDIIMKEATRLEQQQLQLSNNRTVPSTSTPRYQPTPLPTINIPKFSGKLTDWATFRDYFNSLIIQNESLDNLQKLHFLKSFVEGEASLLLKNIPLTENSFLSAWDRLKDRYENSRALIQAELKALFSIQPMRNDSVSSLKNIRNIVTEKITALENLNRFSALTVTPNENKQPDGVSDILVYYISQKLDANTRLSWELHLGNSTDYPHFSTLLNFLDSRIRAMEAIQTKDENKSKSDVARSHVVSNSNCCPFCNSAHKLFKCNDFKKNSAEQRYKFVKSKNLCLNCFAKGHSLINCKSTFSCAICKAKHHTLLHFRQNSQPNDVKPAESQQINSELSPQTSNVEIGQSMHTAPGGGGSRQILLATAQVIVTSASGRSVKVRALLDQGSTWTIITEELAKALRICPDRFNIQLQGVGNIKAGSPRGIAPITISSTKNQNIVVKSNALILKEITNYIPSVDIKILEQPYLKELDLADDELFNKKPIHVLIGADLYGDIIQNGLIKSKANQPVAQNSIFGWILSGNLSDNNPNAFNVSENSFVSCFCVSNEELSKSIQQFWEIEELPRVSNLTKLEQECETHFESTHSRTIDGRYIVRIPFKSSLPLNIGKSKKYAEKSLSQLSKTFVKSPEIFKKYTDFMSDYKEQGHMSQVIEESPDNSQVVYLPHHPVIRESSQTTKLRVVFNASAKTSNLTSLNDHMHIGPKLQGNLFEITLLWRTYRFVYASDITQMYRQILIDEKDRDYQRILWFLHSLTNPVPFRLNTVTYGMAAAPFLALRVLRQLVKDEGNLFPLASAVLDRQIYIDDCLFGADSKEDIIKIRNEVIFLLEKGKFHLRKWASNCLSLLADIDPSDHGYAIEKPFNDEETIKILGIVWIPSLDTYRFKIQLIENVNVTKRLILSFIARLYDPLGWVSPVVIVAKLLIQKLWMKSLKWDDPLPQELRDLWFSYYTDLPNLEKLSIPRWTGQGMDVIESSIHGFSDASNSAYAAVAYLRLIFKSGDIRVILLASRTKVAPIKSLSVPRLELCGALLLTQLISAIKNVPEFRELKSVYWTDSTIVLAWLNKHPSSWHTFIANRVSAIQSVAPFEVWRHVVSDQNPADLGSRGIRASDLLEEQLWWQGPAWLRCPENAWPIILENIPDSGINLEARNQDCHVVTFTHSWLDILATKFSSWAKLIRVVAYVLKFLIVRLKIGIGNCKPNRNILLVELCRESQIVWTRFIQSRLFMPEIKLLEEKKVLPSSNSLIALNPFLDQRRILRVGGRLSNAPLEYERRHPAILKKHFIVEMIIRHYHEKCLHGSTQITLNFIRQSFWILRSKQEIKSLIYKCVTCIRLKATVSEQLMGSLPINRISRPSRPFQHVGIDYAGPIKLRLHKGRGHTSHPAYIAVFVCFAVRAIHLEIVNDYTSDSFIAALKRFVSRRGLPLVIYSDHGTNFKGAQRELAETFEKVIQSPDVQSYLLNDRIRWEFIPPAAAHFGGIWESGVRSVKHHLRRILLDRTPHYEELNTLLCQIEMCLNSRPLCPLTEDPEDLRVLTPGHFLIGGELAAIPEISLLNLKESHLSRWQLWQQLLESFWKVWSRDYLLSLQQRNKWRQKSENLHVNQLILLKQENLPPTKWPLGRVISVTKGLDDLVRVATIKTASGTYVRPITKLILLPVKFET